jgi:membrane protein YdbS with pleckstrin-like domain
MDNAPREAPDRPDGVDTGLSDAPQTTAPADDGQWLDVKPRAETESLKEEPQTAKNAVPPATSDRDEVLYQGSVSLWLGWRAMAGAIGAVLMGLALLMVGWWKGGLLNSAGVYVGLPLALAGALMFGYVYLSLRCLRYKITCRLIERERGILVKRVDSLDLGRVKDVELVQNLMERILRIGTIEILSSDRTDPLMRIEAIPAPRPVYEKLRDTVIRISQERGIIAMDR